MEVYCRITQRVRGALWAHHRKLMPQRQFHRILAYVYNNKYEHQIRFDKMSVVGTEWDGKVQVMTTPGGHMKRVRVHPSVMDLPRWRREQLILSAYSTACARGLKLMEQAQLNIYKQFLKDLQPIIMGIRDNPQFYTVPTDKSMETIGGTLHSHSDTVIYEKRNSSSSSSSSNDSVSSVSRVFRTIPSVKADTPQQAVQRCRAWEQRWIQSPQGKAWSKSLKGKEYFAVHGRQLRPVGAPGAKRHILPLDLMIPYKSMDEARLKRRNWMAFLDNKHVAQATWTKTKIGDRTKQLRQWQEKGIAWHYPVSEQT